MSYVLRKDTTRDCPVCKGQLMAGDRVDSEDDVLQHVDCRKETAAESHVDWATAESVMRTENEELVMLQVAPLGKQGKCRVCFLELPMTKVCDDHGPQKGEA